MSLPVTVVAAPDCQKNWESIRDREGFGVGDLKMGAYATADKGWLLCDGSAVSRLGYPKLFTKIGTAFGVGDGSTTFNLPDGRGRGPIGSGTGTGLTARTLGGTVGAETHLLTAAESGLRDHQHQYLLPGVINQGASPNAINGGATALQNTSGVIGGLAGAPAAATHNNMQPSFVVNFFIKAY